MFLGESRAGNAVNLQQSGFEGAAQEYDPPARDEVRVAVARATAMSSVEMLARIGAFEQHAEQFWTSRRVILFRWTLEAWSCR